MHSNFLYLFTLNLLAVSSEAVEAYNPDDPSDNFENNMNEMNRAPQRLASFCFVDTVKPPLSNDELAKLGVYHSPNLGNEHCNTYCNGIEVGDDKRPDVKIPNYFCDLSRYDNKDPQPQATSEKIDGSDSVITREPGECKCNNPAISKIVEIGFEGVTAIAEVSHRILHDCILFSNSFLH